MLRTPPHPQTYWRWVWICVGLWLAFITLALVWKPQLIDEFNFISNANRELLQTSPANADLTANNFWTYGLPLLGVFTVFCFKKVAGSVTRFINPKVN